MRASRTVDMTEGNIQRLLLMVSLPLLLGNLFQQMYNTVDSMILGRLVSKEALAAVTSVTPLCNTLVKFFNGISIGAGVIISREFGAKDMRGLHIAVETTAALALLLGIVLALISVPFVPAILALMGTPEELMPAAVTYMRIYFGGILFLFVYNMGSCILRAVGDTKRPLYFLIFSSVLNVILDLLFVVMFRRSVAGAAIATVMAEGISAALVCIVLTKSDGPHRLTWSDLRLNWHTARDILILGLPAGIQQALTSFSNAFVQSYINDFSISVIAGWGSHVKIDQLAMLPLQSIGQTTTTFVGQNLGAGNIERARQGTRAAVRLGMTFLAVVAAFMLFFAPRLVRLFNEDPEVVYYGTRFILLMLPFRFACAWNQVCASALRGSGDSKGPMLIMLFSFVACRQIYLFFITKIAQNIYTVGLGYPIGWLCCSVLLLWYYRRSK